MQAPVHHILPLTLIRRPRTLPVPGRVLVRPGQKVNAAEVIAEATMPSQHLLLDLRQGLGIPEASAAERYITRQPGEHLEKGDVIAESGGMFARIVRAPAAGDLVAVDRGQVLLRVASTVQRVLAGVSGTVTELIEDHGAVVETSGVLVQGVWGNGKIDSGLLEALSGAGQEELERGKFDISMRGKVILAGICASADALQAGADLQLRGLILSSMTADLIPVAASLNYPILVTEGFGRIPMNRITLQLLTTNEKRDISINAAQRTTAGERPELVIELPAVGKAAPENVAFAPGQTVRVQGYPYTGRIGTIEQIRLAPVTLPSGLRAQAAEVRLEGEARATIPLVNLEVIL